ncbi:MAG: SDR family NAD(P)-dependent oxidoreductase [Micavibrio sp.]|nr:MAG: SDR family NAD(P)-dependent oxidoreductase [Micavibrio sp.]
MTTKFRNILITGASGGIGAALAAKFAAPKVTLLLTGRDKKRLQNTADACHARQAEVHTATADVTDKATMEALIAEWDKNFPVDLVIANAGISKKGTEEDRESVENVLNVNLNGVINTVYPLIPAMKQRRTGHIAVMSSLAGFRGMPTAVSYSTSKNAVRALGDALRPELKEHGINVTVICPGFIRTPLTDENPFPMPFLMEPERAAARIARGLEKGKRRIAFPWQMALCSQIFACLPPVLTDSLLYRMAKRKRRRLSRKTDIKS